MHQVDLPEVSKTVKPILTFFPISTPKSFEKISETNMYFRFFRIFKNICFSKSQFCHRLPFNSMLNKDLQKKLFLTASIETEAILNVDLLLLILFVFLSLCPYRKHFNWKRSDFLTWRKAWKKWLFMKILRLENLYFEHMMNQWTKVRCLEAKDFGFKYINPYHPLP